MDVGPVFKDQFHHFEIAMTKDSDMQGGTLIAGIIDMLNAFDQQFDGVKIITAHRSVKCITPHPVCQ